MRRRCKDLDVEHGREAAEALRTDAQVVDLVVKLDAELLDPVFRSAGDDLLDVDGVHERFLRHDHCFLRCAADAETQHAGRAPTGAHRRQGLQHPVDDGIRGRQHDELGLVFRTAALGRDGDLQLITRHEVVMDDGGRVVLGVLPIAFGRTDDRGAQDIVRKGVCPVDALVNHLVDGHGGRTELAAPAEIHADLHEYRDDARVLADWPVAFGAHAAVRQDLGDRVPSGWALLEFVGLAQGRDVVQRVVDADVLKGVSDAVDNVFLLDDGH
jgi:hypothetical protein